MRQAMVAAAGIRAVVVVIGGRTSEGGIHDPGIDEEIALARARDLPVVLLGAPGGRSAELAVAAEESREWTAFGNRLTPDQNRHLTTSSDYEAAAALIRNAHLDIS